MSAALDDVVVTLTSGVIETQKRWQSVEVVDADVLSEVAETLRAVPELATLIESCGVALFADRYSGVYSGGKYIATTYEHFYGGDFGGDRDDMGTVDYWCSNSSASAGIGSTPIEAARDLVRRCADLGIGA